MRTSRMFHRDAQTCLVHLFGRGLDDERYVVEKYRSHPNGEIEPIQAKQPRTKVAEWGGSDLGPGDPGSADGRPADGSAAGGRSASDLLSGNLGPQRSRAGCLGGHWRGVAQHLHLVPVKPPEGEARRHVSFAVEEPFQGSCFAIGTASSITSQSRDGRSGSDREIGHVDVLIAKKQPVSQHDVSPSAACRPPTSR